MVRSLVPNAGVMGLIPGERREFIHLYGIFQAGVLEWGAIAFSKCVLHVRKEGKRVPQ